MPCRQQRGISMIRHRGKKRYPRNPSQACRRTEELSPLKSVLDHHEGLHEPSPLQSWISTSPAREFRHQYMSIRSQGCFDHASRKLQAFSSERAPRSNDNMQRDRKQNADSLTMVLTCQKTPKVDEAQQSRDGTTHAKIHRQRLPL